MFVQMFKGPVADVAAVGSVLDLWVERFAHIAANEGWLGSSGGVADDGTLFALGLFESAVAARRNGDRPGQAEWWPQLAKLFTGPVEFHNCTAVEIGRGGGDRAAGFIQVIDGRTSDIARLRRLGSDFDRAMRDARPDIVGMVLAFHDEDPGRYTQVVYFTNEAAARRAAREPPSPQGAHMVQEMAALVDDVVYLDIRAPRVDWPPETEKPG